LAYIEHEPEKKKIEIASDDLYHLPSTTSRSDPNPSFVDQDQRQVFSESYGRRYDDNAETRSFIRQPRPDRLPLAPPTTHPPPPSTPDTSLPDGDSLWKSGSNDSSPLTASGQSRTVAIVEPSAASGVLGSSRPSPASRRSSTKRSTEADHYSASFHENKRRKLIPGKMIQCASYALEFSNGGIRNYILGANIKGGAIEMHYYNRSIILRSSRIDFVNDYRRFLAILHGLRSLSVQQWDYQIDPRPFSTDNARNTLKGRKILLKNGIWLELLETVVQQHRLIGRGTCVVKARVSEDPPVSPRGKKFPNAKTLEHWRGMPLVVKWTSPPKSRVPESDILEQAYRVVRENQADWVLDHLPNLLHYEDLDIPVSNSLQNLFNGFNDYEPRVLRLTVFEELVPITGLHSTSDVVLAYEGIFNCEW